MPPDPPSSTTGNSLVARFDQLPSDATAIAGGKGACLSRMTRAGLPVPPGFVVCSAAFRQFLAARNGSDPFAALGDGLDVHNDAALEAVSRRLREFILAAPLPDEINTAIEAACRETGMEALVAVRSSAVSEDGETASFAGQQETFLNVRGTEAVLRHVKECWASFFTPRALFYRAQKGSLADTQMAVVVQQMVLPDKSGVLFTIDPVQKQREHMVIEAIFGLGEAIVSGLLTPDHYVIDRTSGTLVREFVSIQPTALVYDANLGQTTEVELPAEQGRARVLNDRELNALREMGLRLEALFGGPQDIEWCICGEDLFLLQSRPVTTL